MPRFKALNILNDITGNQAYADVAIDKHLNASGFDNRDKAFITNIVYGTVQNMLCIDYQIKHYSKVPFAKIDKIVLNILRIAIYQIRFMTKVPDSAAVNEAVKLTKRKAYSASGFVNGLLRNILRNGFVFPEDRLEYLSVFYSYPLWLVKKWASEFGDEEAEKLLQAGNTEPPLTIRVNLLKTTVDFVKSELSAEECSVPSGLKASGLGSISENELFKKGFFTVQDIASQKVTIMLNPKPGEKILDTCAAPGGKTTHIAEYMGNKGEIIARDIHPHKLKTIEEASKRLGILIIKTEAFDGKKDDDKYLKYFDKVLVDAPCSGLGIIRKKPDIKWLRKEEDLKKLQTEQLAILESASKNVKNGGVLFYSTCTINKDENEGVIEKFLQGNRDFSLDGEPVTLYPHKDFTDGFFLCRMIRHCRN